MRHAETIVWPGGEHAFRLGIGELRAIEQRSDAGCSVVLMRLLGQQWKVDDVVNPIRLGLIGGGLAEREAQKIIETAMETSSLYGLAIVSADVLRRFIMWETDDEPGEPQAEATTSDLRTQTAKPDGPASTVPEPF